MICHISRTFFLFRVRWNWNIIHLLYLFAEITCDVVNVKICSVIWSNVLGGEVTVAIALFRQSIFLRHEMSRDFMLFRYAMNQVLTNR
jgi:hypothetical protein